MDSPHTCPQHNTDSRGCPKALASENINLSQNMLHSEKKPYEALVKIPITYKEEMVVPLLSMHKRNS